jgi:Mrp family chromosome partitioning ATPase
MYETSDATAIFAPLWRRKWLILAVGIVVAVASYVYYKHAQRTYSASTQVYLGASTEEATAGEKLPKASSGEVTDQATIINAIVIEEVRHQIRKEHKGGLIRYAKVKAKASEKGEFITISAEAHTDRGTVLLVNRVAQAYVRRTVRARERSVNRAITIARRQLARLEAAQGSVSVKSPSTSSSSTRTKASSPSTASILQATTLSSKINELEASLAVPGAEQVSPSKRAELIAPAPKKDAIFGFVIGIVLASIAAYALGRLDRRLRTLDNVEAVLRSRILTALPKVARPIVDRDGQPAPSKQLLEPLRRLYTTLQIGAGGAHAATAHSNGAGKPRTILFLSSDPGDGKSTLIADLALVQRDGGERVAVVEANFRRPVLGRLLGLGESAGGLAEVLAETLSIEDAMQRVVPAPAVADAQVGEQPATGASTALATRARGAGSLFLLAGSRTVENPPALLADPALPETLRALAEEFDYVLIDAPSPLEFSDVMPLLGLVDGIVMVARAGHTRELSAQRFVQTLSESAAAPVLGTVANCVSKSDIAHHGMSSLQQRSLLSRLLGS